MTIVEGATQAYWVSFVSARYQVCFCERWHFDGRVSRHLPHHPIRGSQILRQTENCVKTVLYITERIIKQVKPVSLFHFLF